MVASKMTNTDKVGIIAAFVAAEMFNDGKLDETIMTFDFRDGVIIFGDFSTKVPESYKKKLKETIETYKETGFLPNESNA